MTLDYFAIIIYTVPVSSNSIVKISYAPGLSLSYPNRAKSRVVLALYWEFTLIRK